MALTGVQAYVLKQLQKGQEMIPKMIKMLVDDFQPVADRKRALYERYTIEGVPIQSRSMPDGAKVNNKMNNDFAGEIVDTKIGYVLGNPIKYTLDRNMYEGGFEELYREHQGHINKFIVRNQMNDKDIELGKMISICGVGGREVYIDIDGNEKVANLPAWEMIFLTDSDDKVLYALRLHTQMRMVDNELQELLCVDFYDDEKITYYVENTDDEDAPYLLDDEQEQNPMPHVFGATPIVKIINNEEEMGDFERVLSLIDGYDKTMSDVNSEIEQFRLAYMKFIGFDVDEETLEQAKSAGGFQIPEGGDVGFITKHINDAVVEHHLNRLEENINRFSKHVNLSDKDFGGGDSSLANKYKINAMETKAKVLEVKMKSALLRQFEIVSNAWIKKGVTVDYLNMYFDFSRNLPVNILEEADETTKLKGFVSERTRLSRLSFVDDIEYELEQMQKDAERDGSFLEDEVPTEERFGDLDSFNEEEDELNGEE